MNVRLPHVPGALALSSRPLAAACLAIGLTGGALAQPATPVDRPELPAAAQPPARPQTPGTPPEAPGRRSQLGATNSTEPAPGTEPPLEPSPGTEPEPDNPTGPIPVVPGTGEPTVTPEATPAGIPWGSYQALFAKDSPWNQRPVSPKFDSFVIPTSQYSPQVAEGKWSSGVFLANAGDPAVTVTGLAGTQGVWDPDAGVFRPSIVIPRWPADVVPASAADGHADIVDPAMNVVHSFFKLRQVEGQWQAQQYAWTRLDGRGWGTPAHYFQGARAAAVATSGGLIRKHEVNDGRPQYYHSLAMSLTHNALAANPAYVFPATSADRDAATTNTGKIPEGALMMLPPGFDLATIRTAALRKVAQTLKTYGARVVDRNTGTPYVIYVENGSGFNLHAGGWNTTAAADLERIRLGLRRVVSVSGWVDGEGQPATQSANLNLLSMRGHWHRRTGTESGQFDTWRQEVVFPPTATPIEMVNTSGRNMHAVTWAAPLAGKTYRLSAFASGGATLRLELRDKSSGATRYASQDLGDGQSVSFTWPSGTINPVVVVRSGTGGESAVRGELVRQ